MGVFLFYNKPPNFNKIRPEKDRQKMENQINIEGNYSFNNDTLTNGNIILKVNNRYKAKKGQAKRFIGFIDPSKPADEQFRYISSLYSEQGLKNVYKLEHQKEYYTLRITGVNSVRIEKTIKEPALKFETERA